MVDVRMPDGVVVRFPDDMPRDQIRDMIATKFPQQAQQQQAQAAGAPTVPPMPRARSETGSNGNWRTYTIQAPDGRKIRIQAADEATALRGAEEWATANPSNAQGSSAQAQQPGEQVTINIAGQRVKVGREFLQLSPEQQNATVDEIAAELGIRPNGDPEAMKRFEISLPDGRKFEVQAPDQQTAWNALQQQIGGQQQKPQRPQPGMITLPDGRQMTGQEYAALPDAERQKLREQIAAANPAVNVRNVESNWLDPAIQGATWGWGDEIAAGIHGGIAAATGGDFGETYDAVRENALARYEHEKYVNPIGSTAAEIGGAVGTAIPAAIATGGGSLFGTGATLGSRVLGGLAVGGLQSAIYGAGQSDGDLLERAPDAIEAGKTGVVLGGAIPVVGSALRTGGAAVSNKAGQVFNSIFRPTAEAERRVGTAVLRDQTANPGMVISQADEAIAQQADIPLLNVDRGGETTRALARSMANQSPEARQVIEKAASDRFAGQGDRATRFIRRLVGGNADDVGTLDALKRNAEFANSMRYKPAYKAPAARAIWTPEILQLMQAGPFRAAIEGAEETATNYAATTGGKAVRNPFQFLPDGSVTLRKMPDGSTALPNLEFWDIVQRNLRRQAEQAARQGDNLLASQVGAMRRQLNNALDSAVPQFKQARAGAASFFGAEDALEAGKKFATTPRAIPEAQKAFAKLTEPEKRLFATGYASELIDRIKATRDRANVISQMFGSQASREMNELVFGKARAQELEAYVRVENLADMLRGAMGNSTTARQLVELGIGAGVGGVPAFLVSGGDWRAGLAGAAGVRGARFVAGKAESRIMQEVGKLLTSGRRADLDRVINNAMLSQKWMDAVKSFTQTVEGVARSAVPPVASDPRQGAQPAPAFQ